MTITCKTIDELETIFNALKNKLEEAGVSCWKQYEFSTTIGCGYALIIDPIYFMLEENNET